MAHAKMTNMTLSMRPTSQWRVLVGTIIPTSTEIKTIKEPYMAKSL